MNQGVLTQAPSCSSSPAEWPGYGGRRKGAHPSPFPNVAGSPVSPLGFRESVAMASSPSAGPTAARRSAVTREHAEPASGTAQGGGDAAAVEGSPARPAEPPQGDPAALSRASSIPPERPPNLGLCGADPPTWASAVTT